MKSKENGSRPYRAWADSPAPFRAAAASWDASLLREISFPDDSYMIPVGVVERPKAAREAA